MRVVEEFKKSKELLISLAQWLKDEGFLDESEYHDFSKNLQSEKIKLAVAGQIKYGKSTLINALFFGRKILPTSDIPMTATLTYIEYGETEKYTVETYSERDWETINGFINSSAISKEIQEAYIQLTSEARKRLANKHEDYLGKKIDITRGELVEYVGADGRFTPITKALYIKLPHELLKEITIVDTPGFNDPISSREVEAEKFLKEADALLFLLYAGRAMDSTDRYLLVDRMNKFGLGGIIIIINKYDELLMEEGSINAVDAYIKRIIQEIQQDSELGSGMKEVLANAPFIKVSALMALLGKLPDDEMQDDDRWYLEKFRSNFPFVKSRKDLIEYSGLKELEDELLRSIRQKIGTIRIGKFKNRLEGKISEKLRQTKNRILDLTTQERGYSLPRQKLEDRITKLDNYIRNEYAKVAQFAPIEKASIEIIRNYRSEIEEAIKKEFDNINFRDIGFMEISYDDYVSYEVSKAIYEVGHKINTMLNEMQEECVELIYNKVDEMIDGLIEHQIAKGYGDISHSHKETIKERVNEVLKERLYFNTENTDYSKPDIGARFLFLGESKDGAKGKAIRYKKEVMDTIAEKLNVVIDEFLEKGISSTLHSIGRIIEESTIVPIRKALKEAKDNYDDKERRLNEIENEKKKLEIEERKIEEIKKTFAQKISILEIWK